jgi:protein-S-isoprenylcysteine O-methyltransferase Ste14
MRGPLKSNVLTLVVVVLVLVVAGIRFGNLPWTPARIAGVVIGLSALPFFVLARIQLGGSFSALPRARTLVTHGLYSRIRNPIYLFGGLLIAGFFLYFNPRFLWIFVLLIPVQVYRVRQEEKVLEAKFGDQYREYKSRTWF